MMRNNNVCKVLEIVYNIFFGLIVFVVIDMVILKNCN